jgi:hypothetical protein
MTRISLAIAGGLTATALCCGAASAAPIAPTFDGVRSSVASNALVQIWYGPRHRGYYNYAPGHRRYYNQAPGDRGYSNDVPGYQGEGYSKDVSGHQGGHFGDGY